MSSASWALQQAVFTALSADETLTALAGDPLRLYDAPPRSALYPYLVLTEDSEKNWDMSGVTGSSAGSEHLLTVSAWSQAGGRKEIKEIAAALRAALDQADLALSGHHLVGLRFVVAVYARTNDGKTYHAQLTFRAVTEPES